MSQTKYLQLSELNQCNKGWSSPLQLVYTQLSAPFKKLNLLVWGNCRFTCHLRNNTCREKLGTCYPVSPNSTCVACVYGGYNIITGMLMSRQSRYRTFPSQQGFLLLPFCNHIHFPLAPTPSYSATTNLISISIILSFQEHYINAIIQCITLWDWFLHSI